MNADEILGSVLERYQACSSYTDNGALSSDIGQVQFKTFFCRPNKFRFEWTVQKSAPNVILSDSSAQAVYFDGEILNKIDSLPLAIAGATGVSLGVAPLIAHLLMPGLFDEHQYQSLNSMGPYSLIQEDSSSFEIRADWREGCWTTLFVDKADSSISCIEIGSTPSSEEKRLGIEALERLQAPELEQVKTLALVETKPIKMLISYNQKTFDSPIESEIFSQI